MERISLAKAVLEFLNKNDNIVIASSHDLELIELLSKDFEMFYFTETIKDNYLNFDHTIKPGSLKTTNAIKIIEIENYPQSIIDEAYKMTREYKPGTFLASEKSNQSISWSGSRSNPEPRQGNPARIKSAVVRLHAIKIFHATARRSKAFTSLSCGCASIGSQKKTIISSFSSAIMAPIC